MNAQPFLRPLSEDQLGLLIQSYLDECEYGGLSVTTVANYRGTLEKFHWWVRESGRPLDPAALSPGDLREYLRYLKDAPQRWGSTDPKASKPITPSSLNAYYVQLKTFFTWLVNQEEIDRSPMDKRLRRPRYIEDQPDPFSADELARIATTLRALPDHDFALRDRAIVALLLDVALRASEIAAVTLADLDMQSGTLIVRAGKGGKSRTLQIGLAARRPLRRYLRRFRMTAEPDLSEPLFLSQKRRALTRSGIQQITERIGTLASVHPANPHRFRHTAAVNAVRAGMDLFHLQQMLGHTSLEICRRYVQLAETDMAKAAKEHSPLDALRLNL